MRFIHTSDWHLGKSLKGQSLLDDQAHILNELLRMLDDQRADALIIAGDIYDRSVPPADAVELFNEMILSVVERGITILSVAGNHDSAKRLNFGSQLFERSKFFLRTLVSADDDPIVLNDEHGKIYFSLLPYFEPSQIRNAFGIDDNITFDDAGKIFIDHARSKIPDGARSIAIGHAFITGGERSDSETQNVGGADNVNAAHFDGYNYVALGHLHKHQCMSSNVIRYSGSPLKYSFDEWRHRKGALSVEIGADGRAALEFLPLTPKHDLLVIEGMIEDVLTRTPMTDYVAVRLLNREQVLNARAKLEELFPNLLAIEKVNFLRETSTGGELKRAEGASVLDQFKDFFEYQTGDRLDSDQEAALIDCLRSMREEEER